MICKPYLILVIFIILNNCDESEKIMDVQYYIDHPNKMKAKIKECKNNPWKHKKNSNCQNAEAAQNKKMWNMNEEGDMPKIKVPDEW